MPPPAQAQVALFGGRTQAPAAAEIFGGTYSGEIYRRLWLTVPLANFIGTSIVARWKDAAYNMSAAELAAGIDESAFSDAFGAPKAELDSLLVSRD